MLSMLAVTSCSQNSKMTGILDHVPADMDIVAVGDLNTILESAGGSIEESKIKMPSYILDELSSSQANKLNDFNSFLKNSSVNPDVCVIMANYNDKEPIILFSFSDKKKFINEIEDEGFREKDDEDGVVYYSKKVYESTYDSDFDQYDHIAVADSYAYWMKQVSGYRDIKPIRVFQRLIDDAANEPFSKTSFADYITSGNAGGASIKIPRELRQELRKSGLPSSVIDMYEGVVCLKGSLSDDKATVDLKWFGEDGKAKNLDDLENAVDMKATIDKDALRYLGKNESIVYAFSLKDVNWSKMFDQMASTMGMSESDRAILTMTKGYLENIDGTIAMGFGLTNGLESIFKLNYGIKIFDQFDMTIVIDTKEGKTKGTMNDLKGLLETAGMPYEDTSKGFTIEIPDEDATIYAEAADNHIILSNRKISKSDDNPAVDALDFSRYIVAAAIAMDHNNKLLRDVNINNDIMLTSAFSAGKLEGILTLEIKGGKSEGVIAKAVKIILDIISQEKSIDARYDEFRRENGLNYYNSYDYPYEAVEEAVVVEEYDDSVYTDSVAVADW